MPTWKFMKASHEAEVDNYERIVSLQCEYSLFDRYEEVSVLPLCEDQDIGVLPWPPLADRFLADKYERGKDSEEGRDGRVHAETVY